MTDYFALFNLPRRPWLDVGQLKSRFLILSAQHHPDHASTAQERTQATERFTELNVAHNTLRDPRERLHHLLLLEGGQDTRQVRHVPPAIADIILPAEQICREASAFLSERAGATSPLLKAQQFERALDWQERVSVMQKQLTEHRTQLDALTQALNEKWEAAEAVPPVERQVVLPLARLEELYRAYSYVTRFQQQLQERFVQLAI